jgi:acyl-CoA synthetase (AMP-forming)/AMP-acid ligase II
VPLNFLLSRSDLEYVARDAGLDAVITVGPMVDFIGGPIPGLVEIRPDQMRFTGIPPVRMTNPLQRDDLAVVLYTSGTSGRPKGVMLTCGNIAANVRQCQEWVDFGRNDTILGVLPQFHSFGLTVLTMLPLATGARASTRRAVAARRRPPLGPARGRGASTGLASTPHVLKSKTGSVPPSLQAGERIVSSPREERMYAKGSSLLSVFFTTLRRSRASHTRTCSSNSSSCERAATAAICGTG